MAVTVTKIPEQNYTITLSASELDNMRKCLNVCSKHHKDDVKLASEVKFAHQASRLIMISLHMNGD